MCIHLRKREMPAFGTATTVNGKLTLTNDDGAQFRSYLMESYAPGSLIQIAGTSCVPNLLCSIASIDSAAASRLR